MRTRYHHWLRGLLGGLGGILLSGGVAGASTTTLEYDVYWKFLRLMEFKSVAQAAPGGATRVATDSRTVGIVDTFFPWTARAEAVGALRGGGLSSQAYHTWSRFRDRVQQVDVRWRGGEPEVNVSGELPEKTQRAVVSPALRRDTIDPLSAVMGLSRGLADDGRCGGTFPVFDGLRRYDLSFVDRGEVELEESGNDAWSGAARLCEARFEMLGGAWRGDVKPEDNPTRILAWLRPVVAGGEPVPVRFQIVAEAGALDVHLRAAHVEGDEESSRRVAE